MGPEVSLIAANLEFVQLAFYVFMFVWLMFMAGCIGSFMNVVIYRLPAGLSTAKPNSRCPHCCHAIRWYDNIPVISWFVLGARCRDCHAPIAGRYAAVEAFVAAVLVVLAIIEVYLPTRGRWFLDRSDYVMLWSSYIIHTAVLCTTICAAFMEFDRRRVPLKLFYMASTLGLIGLLTISTPPVLVQFVHLAKGPVGYLRDAAIGGVLGFLVAPFVLAANTTSRRFRPSRRPLVLIGLVLGWQALLFVAVLGGLLNAVVRSVGRRSLFVHRIPPSASIVAALIGLLYSAPWIRYWVSSLDAAWMTEQDRTGLMSWAVIAGAILTLLLLGFRPQPSGSFRKSSLAR